MVLDMTEIKYPVPEENITRYGSLFYYVEPKGTSLDEGWRGLISCKDGPAVKCSNDEFWYCIDGCFYSFDHWCVLTKKTEEEKMLLKLQYGTQNG